MGPDSFPSCHNVPEPKSGQDLDPDKPVWSMSCQEDVNDHHFCVFFVVFVPDSTTFATDPRDLESVSGSVPVEHPY